MQQDDVTLRTAYWLCRSGIKVFPVQPRGKTPIFKGDWRSYATTDFNQLKEMTQYLPEFNLAVRLGPESGIVDVELDSEEAAIEFDQLVTLFGVDPSTVSFRSSRGIHRFYRWEPKLSPHGKAVSKYRGIEIRTGGDVRGAYSVVPPSIHESGVLYQWIPGQSPWESQVREMPVALVTFFHAALSQMSAGPTYASVEVSADEDGLCPAPGERHQVLLHLAHLLRGKARFSTRLCFDMLMGFQQHVGKVGEKGVEGAAKEVQDILVSVRPAQADLNPFEEIDTEKMYEAARQMRKELDAPLRTGERMPEVFPQAIERMASLAWEAMVPRHFVLMNLLAAVSSATGASTIISAAPTEPATGLQIYSMGVGESGSGKSRALKMMLRYFSEKDHLITNTTPEALMAALSRHMRGVLLQLSEGKQLNRMLGRYSGTQGSSSENSVLLEAWSGDTISVIRQDKAKSIRINDPFLTIAATVQPHNLHNCFGVDDVMEGMMQRMLIYGGDKVPEENNLSSSAELQMLLSNLYQAFARLEMLRQGMFDDTIRQVESANPARAAVTCQPLHLVLSPEATTIWRGYARWKRSPELMEFFPEEHPFRTDIIRHAEYVLRLTGLLFMLDMSWNQDQWMSCGVLQSTAVWVPMEYLRQAIVLMEWLWGEKQRLMLDIVEDRYHKANPLSALRSMQSLPEGMERFARRRQRVLKNRLKGAESWSLRDYYRYLRLDADIASQEVACLMAAGLVSYIGEVGKAKHYQFVLANKERDPSRTESL